MRNHQTSRFIPASANLAMDDQSGPLVLDLAERCIRGVDMPPLLTGELKLLTYLGLRPHTWHSSYGLSVSVFGREDAAGRQLVWKYVSTLRQKTTKDLPGLIEVCRRRGYQCRSAVACVTSS